MGMAQILQSDMAKIGVRLRIDAKDGPRWAEASDRSEFDINMHGYGRTNADPSLMFKGTVAWRPEKNPTGFDDPRYLQLVEAQGAVVDREKRKPLVKQLVEYVLDQAFVIPVAGTVQAWAMDPKVEGLTMLPFGFAYMDKVWLNK
jgi:ABC-type transport system substrate-binding protein